MLDAAAAAAENRFVIDLNGAKIDAVVDSNVETAADRRREIRVVEIEIDAGRIRRRAVSRRAREAEFIARHGDARERMRERLESRFRGVVFNLHAAQKIIGRGVYFLAVFKIFGRRGRRRLPDNEFVAAVRAGYAAFDAEIFMNIAHVRALETVAGSVISAVDLLMRIADVEFVFLVFVRLVLSKAGGTQDTRQA